ncbi:FG-GAP-like repeat-containing protein [Streptomyces solicathayae]|uniref:Tachylectin-related carbohydrate-binding protein n=1 Tax=Streptomyces solicathayae TaxID=3081768 RepID=A0ABZ0LTF1_9ACTN|nr:FG-GAP-like repeat-containing protein [Streptomyces sp. HUAS YS2]WOX22712.1 tachylectin-related carbohydrate-binding protein [Streptomyces sp. HUAS YS2]
MTSRTTRRHLAASVAVALALTVGAGGLAAPVAVAAPVAAGEGQSAAFVPVGSSLMGIGSSGVLTATKDATETYHYRWTRLADGAVTELPGQVYGSGTDTVLLVESDAYVLRDMTGSSAPVRIPRDALNSGYRLLRPLGSTLLMSAANPAGGTELHLVSRRNGTLFDRTVTGLPSNASSLSVDVDSPPGTALLRYDVYPEPRVALVDLASAAVVETRAPAYTSRGVTDVAASATHIAWGDLDSVTGAGVSTASRGSGEVERTFVGGGGVQLHVDLLGDWVLYSGKGAETATTPHPLFALTARNMKTGATLELLDHSESIGPTPDGALVAEGGSVEHGEGLYRIELGADGAPVTTLVASTGVPTAVNLLGYVAPSGVIDLDKTPLVPVEATFSRSNVRLEIEFTHVASQRRHLLVRLPERPGAEGPVTVKGSWDGRLDRQQGEVGSFLTAYNGDYTWRLRAVPMNGVGPAAERTGSFRVLRTPKPHDFSDNGSPDALGVDSAGRLTRYDSSTTENGSTSLIGRSGIGTGWQIYDRLVAPGNVGGTAQADVVARDRSGVLWLYEGTGKLERPFELRKKVGAGWQIYNKITAGSDLTGDGRTDLLATDAAGVLWLYKGTGSATAPFAPRVKAGNGGWGIYNKIVATGNIAGGAAGDLVARDASGVLWLYPGNGNGTFATRIRVGSGWNAFAHVLAVGDANHDRRPEVFAYKPDGRMFVYESTGDANAPFKPGRATYYALTVAPGEFTQLF